MCSLHFLSSKKNWYSDILISSAITPPVIISLINLCKNGVKTERNTKLRHFWNRCWVLIPSVLMSVGLKSSYFIYLFIYLKGARKRGRETLMWETNIDRLLLFKKIYSFIFIQLQLTAFSPRPSTPPQPVPPPSPTSTLPLDPVLVSVTSHIFVGRICPTNFPFPFGTS